MPASEREIAAAERLVASGEEGEETLLSARQRGLEVRSSAAAATARLRQARAALTHGVGRRLES